MIHVITNTKNNDKIDQEKHLEPAVRAATLWIENVLKISLPANTGLRSALASGEILCCLINTIVPGAIKRINRCPNRAAASDNLSLFLKACETNCGISKSKLFDVNNFDDIFDRTSKSSLAGSKSVKYTEKVVITIFWLAKFVEQEQKFADFPKLDYSAYAELVPVKSTQASDHRPSYTSSPINKHYFTPNPPSVSASGKTSQPVLHQSSMGNGTSLPSQDGVSPLSIGGYASVIHRSSAPTLEATNHTNTLPTPNVATVARPPLFRPTSITTAGQRNNNGMDEDDWQASLDAWRERRRQISRMEARTLTSFEEIRQEEERKKQEAARERLKEIITQHRSISNPYISSEYPDQPIDEPLTPQLGILSHKVNGNCEFQGVSGDVPSATPVTNDIHGIVSSTKSESPVPTAEERSLSDCTGVKSSITNGGSQYTSAVEPQSPNLRTNGGKAESVVSESVCDSENGLPSSAADYHEVQIRIQSKPKCVEVRWGLTLVARGPSNTAPFVVQHVKIGSTADVCEINRGDILTRVHHTDVSHKNYQAGAHRITLADLEELLDCLCKSGQPIKVHVLRKRSNTEDDLGEDTSACSPVLGRHTSPSASPVLPNDEPSSDVDEHKPMDTALIVNRNPCRAVNSIELVKQISHELQHASNDRQPCTIIEKQSISSSQGKSKAYEIEPFMLGDSSSEISSLAHALNNIPTSEAFTTRI